LVEVTLVKTAVDGLVLPIWVPLIVPPVRVTFGETRPAALTVRALRVVPEAVLKPNQPVEVPLVNARLVTVPLVSVPFVANRFVVVTEVAVADPR